MRLCIDHLINIMQAANSLSISPRPEFHYPGYVWITPAWYRDNWWKEEVAKDSEIPCSNQDLEQFILNTLSIQISNSTTDPSSPTDVNLVRQKKQFIARFYNRDCFCQKTTTEFEDRYFKKAEMSGYNMEGPLSEITYLAYDAVWTLALGINMYAAFELYR